MDKVLPCPFCGEQPKASNSYKQAFACQTTGCAMGGQSIHINMWNRRHQPSAPVQPESIELVTLTGNQAEAILEAFGGEGTSITIIRRLEAGKDAEDVSDMPAGLYLYYTEYPEEGMIFLGEHDQDFRPAYLHASPSAQPQPEEEIAQDGPLDPDDNDYHVNKFVALGLDRTTATMVGRFARHLAKKLHAAKAKYGYTDGWAQGHWETECRAALMEHIGKGDPLDVAAFAAFMWHHGWNTKAAPDAVPVSLDEIAREIDVRFTTSVDGGESTGKVLPWPTTEEIVSILKAAPEPSVAAEASDLFKQEV